MVMSRPSDPTFTTPLPLGSVKPAPLVSSSVVEATTTVSVSPRTCPSTRISRIVGAAPPSVWAAASTMTSTFADSPSWRADGSAPGRHCWAISALRSAPVMER